MTYLAQVQSRAVHVSEGTSILDGNVNLGFKKIFSLAVSPWVNYLISLASHFSFFPLRFLLALNEIIYEDHLAWLQAYKKHPEMLVIMLDNSSCLLIIDIIN